MKGGFRFGTGRPGWRRSIELFERADARRPPASRFKIEHVACHFGGSRPYFRCARCGRRCLYLYKLRSEWHYACRRCLDLAYPCENYTRIDALRLRQRKLMAKLGPHGSKPRGMHWRMFWRIRNQVEALATEVNALLVVALTQELANLRGGA